MIKLIIIAIVILFLGFVAFNKSEEVDLKRCKMTYGSSYTLGHSPANSSIKWCQAPDGTQKAL